MVGGCVGVVCVVCVRMGVGGWMCQWVNVWVGGCGWVLVCFVGWGWGGKYVNIYINILYFKIHFALNLIACLSTED